MIIRKHVALAIGTAMLCSAGSAFAWDARTETPDFTLYWAGATASSLSAQELTVASVCDSDPGRTGDTNLFYVKATSGTPIDRPGNDWAIACMGVAGGKTGLVGKILIVKRDRDGSGAGVGPLQTANPVTFLTVNNTTCSIPVTPGVNGAPNIAAPEGGAVAVTGCTATYTTNHLVEVGTSDLEADKFFDINTPTLDGSPAPYLPGVPFGSQASLASLTFNTPVTLSLRNSLQSAQFPGSSHCNPSHPDYNQPSTVVVPGRAADVWAETEECMPSLTRSELASIFTGKLVTWNQLLSSAGTSVPGLTGSIQICRRLNGSGSQATLNALITGFPCDGNKADNAFDVVLPRTPNGTTVIGNSGSGDVDNCLHNLNASATNPRAIGILSVEGRNTGLDRNWRYIKIDGVAPTLANIHNGDYWFWTQQAMQTRVGLTGNQAAIVNALQAGLNNPTTLRTLNDPVAPSTDCSTGANKTRCGSLYSFGQSGWLATPTPSLTYDVALNTANPVNAFTREVSAGRVNICQVPLKATPGGATNTKGVVVAPNPDWTP